MVTREPITTSPSISTCAQILQSQPICASGRMTQNCQTLVPDPMLAPSVCAEGWICFFRALSARLLRGLNAFLLPECAAVSIRCYDATNASCSSRDVCQVQNMPIVGFLGFMNCPTRQSSQ